MYLILFFFTTRWHFTRTSQAGNPYCWALSYIDEDTLLNYYHIKSKMATRDVWWREREVQGGDERGYNWRHLYFTYRHPVNHLPSLSLPLLLPLLRSLRALRFHTHPQLLVPEQQFASGFIELQPVDLGVVADGSKIVAPGQVHWGERGGKKDNQDVVRLAVNSRLETSQSFYNNEWLYQGK